VPLTLTPAPVRSSTAQSAVEAQLPPVSTPLTSAPSPAAPTAPTAAFDVVEDWGLASFPASDPPSNW
jgi:hypothetical protein